MSRAHHRFVQFRPTPDVRAFLDTASKSEAATVRHLCNRAIREEAKRMGWTPAESQTNDRDVSVTSERQD
jgi:hypothetical protein